MELSFYRERFKNNRETMISNYKDLILKDMNEKAKTMKQGETLTHGNFNNFHYESNKAIADNIVTAHRQKAYEIIGELKKDLNSYLSEIPTEETTRALQSMKLVKNPTEDYIYSMLERHGDNYTAVNVISEYARENDIHIDKLPERVIENEKATKLYESMTSEVDRYYNSSSLDKLTPGTIAFIDNFS